MANVPSQHGPAKNLGGQHRGLFTEGQPQQRRPLVRGPFVQGQPRGSTVGGRFVQGQIRGPFLQRQQRGPTVGGPSGQQDGPLIARVGGYGHIHRGRYLQQDEELGRPGRRHTTHRKWILKTCHHAALNSRLHYGGVQIVANAANHRGSPRSTLRRRHHDYPTSESASLSGAYPRGGPYDRQHDNPQGGQPRQGGVPPPAPPIQQGYDARYPRSNFAEVRTYIEDRPSIALCCSCCVCLLLCCLPIF